MQGPDCQLLSPESIHQVRSLVQPCSLPMNTLERILALPLLGGPIMSYQSQTKSNASSLGSLRCPFSRCQTVFSTPRAPYLTLIHTGSPKQLSVHELSLSPLRKQLLFILPKNLSAGLSQDRQMLHFSPPNPFFNPGLNDTLSSFAFNHLFYLLTHVPLFFPFFFIVVKYTSYQI